MKFFGRRHDQSLGSFLEEVRQLSEADKAELIPLLEAELNEKIDVETLKV